MHAITCRVHFRSYTTGMVHPKAACPRITPGFFSQRFRACFLIRVCGPYVGVLFDDMLFPQATTVLAVWDWRTGSQIMVFNMYLVKCQTDFGCGPAYSVPRVSLFHLHIG